MLESHAIPRRKSYVSAYGASTRGLNLYLTVLRSSIPLARAAQGVVMPFAGGERGAGAHHQKLAQVAVAHLGDPPEPRFAAGRVLARRQAEEGGELAPAGEDAG